MKEIWVKVDWLDKDYDIEVSNLRNIKKVLQENKKIKCNKTRILSYFAVRRCKNYETYKNV